MASIQAQPADLRGLLKEALRRTLVPVALLCLPVFVVIAVLVRWDSPGAVLHRRRVLGLAGQEFSALKFRTHRDERDLALLGVERNVCYQVGRVVSQLL